MKTIILIVAMVLCVWSCYDYMKAIKDYERLHGELETKIIRNIVSNEFSKDLSLLIIAAIMITCF